MVLRPFVTPGNVYSSVIAPLPWPHPRHHHALPSPYLRPKKKALLIGICYRDQPNCASDNLYLTLPWKDVEGLKRLLIGKYGYHRDDIIMLTDKPSVEERFRPTHENIERELRAFLGAQTRGDQYLFYYAGHSYQERSSDAGEEDGKDELILPCDAYDPGGNIIRTKAIVDDFLKEHLVIPLHEENRLVAIFDSCHSATLLDATGSTHGAAVGVEQYVECWKLSVAYPCGSATPNKFCDGYCRRSEAFGNVLCISACKDSQQAYEFEDGTSMTSIIISLLEKERNPSLKRLMRVISPFVSCKFRASSRRMRKEYRNSEMQSGEKFGPIADPQLSSLNPQNMNMPFIL